MEKKEEVMVTPEELVQKEAVQKEKKNYWWWFLLGLVFFGLVGGVFWFVRQNQVLSDRLKKVEENEALVMTITPSVTVKTEKTIEEDKVASWVLYENEKHQVSFKYSPEWKLNSKEANQTNNAWVELTKGEAKIKVMMAVDGIGGMGQDLEGVPVTVDGVKLYKYEAINEFSKTKTYGLTDQLKESLGFFKHNGKVYSIKLSYPSSLVDSTTEIEIKGEFDLLLNTFKFSLQSVDEILSQIPLLTKPMIWSKPTKGMVLGIDQEEEGMVIESSSEGGKMSALLTTDSILVSDYGWKWETAADGPGSSLTILKKGDSSLVVRRSGGVYRVLLK